MSDSEEKLWRVEATVPACQWVKARTKEDAIELACSDVLSDHWRVETDAPISREHVVTAELECAEVVEHGIPLSYRSRPLPTED